MASFEELDIPIGFMADKHIRLALENGCLIEQRSWESDLVRHASYTLRIGDHVEVAHATSANIEEARTFKRHDLKHGQHIELKPGDTAKLYSIEVLRLPASVLAFTVARGLLFFESLVPENTYVDPGFTGTLYTTVTNLSNRVITLEYGDPITRLFFYKLPIQVEESYQKGSSKGLKQRLESARATRFGTDDECRSARSRALINELRRLPLGGTQFAELVQRQYRYVLWIAGYCLLLPMFLYLAGTSPWFQEKIGSFLSKVVAFAGAIIVSKLLQKAWEKLKQT